MLVPDPDPKDAESDASTGSGPAGAEKKPQTHVITRLQFMRDGEEPVQALPRGDLDLASLSTVPKTTNLATFGLAFVF